MASQRDIFINADIPGIDEGLRAFIKRVIKTGLEAEGVDFPYEVNVLLTSDNGIQKINHEQRGVDRATDVLSFPMFDLFPGRLPHPETDADPETGKVPLGDIALSMERMSAQAQEYGHSNLRELAYLLTHSVLHLLGYDHSAKKINARTRGKNYGASGFKPLNIF